MTSPLYMSDMRLLTTPAQVITFGRDKRGLWLSVDQTVLHPQGGGQPADQGTLSFGETQFAIHHVAWSSAGTGAIQHYCHVEDIGVLQDLCGQRVVLAVDAARRRLHARLHSAGHLIAALVESIAPDVVAKKGHHFPGEAYVEFAGPRLVLEHFISQQAEIAARLTQTVATNAILRSTLTESAGRPQRTVEIVGFAAVGCGGTHVASLSEIGALAVRSMRIKSGQMRIAYE